MNDPHLLGERVTALLAGDHGEDYWRRLIEMNGRAWLQIADESLSPKQDIYDGKLSELSAPALFIHGKRDPRTEPDELDAVRQALPDAGWVLIEEGGHSPHSERIAAAECSRGAARFLEELTDTGR